MNKPRILIVEDEPAIADNIQYALETEGFQTIRHSEGGHVLSLLHDETIDLIILDIGLPDINGFELCRQIRRLYSIPVIFLTARSDEIDRVVGLEIGGDDYVVKPFSPRELSARVKAVLRRTRKDESMVSNAGRSVRFQVDTIRHRILYFSEILELSRYEYDILKTFIDRPGQVYTREQLMEKIWEEPETSMDRAVDAHIKNIRKKLRKICSDKDPIQTHRGIGYSLKEDV